MCSEVSLIHARDTCFFAYHVTFNTVNKILFDEPAFDHCPNCMAASTFEHFISKGQNSLTNYRGVVLLEL